MQAVLDMANSWTQENALPNSSDEAPIHDPEPTAVKAAKKFAVTIPTSVVTTSLTEDVKAGATKFQVVSTRGMRVGQKIRIGTEVYEEAVINGFGSIHLVNPLRIDHPRGDAVVVLENGRSDRTCSRS